MAAALQVATGNTAVASPFPTHATHQPSFNDPVPLFQSALPQQLPATAYSNPFPMGQAPGLATNGGVQHPGMYYAGMGHYGW